MPPSSQPGTPGLEKPREGSAQGSKPVRNGSYSQGFPQDIHRTLPHSLEAEQGLLGSMLIAPAEVIDDCIVQIDEAAFYQPTHATIFALIVELWNKQQPADLITLSQALRDRKQLELVGGSAYLSSLIGFTPTAANAIYYLEIVRDKAMLRAIIATCTDCAGRAYEDRGEVHTLLDDIERDVLAINEDRQKETLPDMREHVMTAIETIEKLYDRKGTITGLSTGFGELDRMTSGLHGAEMFVIAARPSMGKCLAHDAEVLLADGRVATMEEIHHRRDALLLTLDDDLRLRVTSPSDFIDDGIKPVFRVTTALGRTVESTLTHPFLTLDGWQPLAELRAGVPVAVPRRLEVFGHAELPEGEVKLLGYLLGGDGPTGQLPRFASGQPAVRADYARAVLGLDGLVARAEAAADGPPVALLPAVLKRRLREWGLTGRGARARFVPAAVFPLCRAQLALFLNRLFASGGWVGVPAGGPPQIGFAAVSGRLARQIQHLLLRFGIIAAVRHRAVADRGGQPADWQLLVTDAGSLRKFATAIGIFGQEEALARLAAALPERTLQHVGGAHSPPADASHPSASRSINPGVDLGPQYHASTDPDSACDEAGGSDVFWDEIVSIEYVGEKQVYDLTIPGTHNFVANDLCVHNTALAMNIAENVAVTAKHPVAIFSLEMSSQQLVQRLLCSRARVNLQKVRDGFLSERDFPSLTTAASKLAESNIFIDDTSGLGILELRAKARRLKQRHDIQLIVIDYLQLLRSTSRRAQDNRQIEIAEISSGIKALAKELNIPVIVLAQLNRNPDARSGESKGRPRLSDLRESGSIEQDADVVGLLVREEYYAESEEEKEESRGKAKLIIAKQRNGPIGDVDLTFLKEFTRFEDRAPESN